MLGGASVTDRAREHAREMLESGRPRAAAPRRQRFRTRCGQCSRTQWPWSVSAWSFSSNPRRFAIER